MSEITPNTPNPVREDEYYEALAAKLGIPASAIPRTPVWRNEEELAALVQLFTNTQGSSGGGVLEITIDSDTGALNKTWQEIHDAIASGKLCILMDLVDGVNVGAHMVTDAYMSVPPGGSDIEYNVATVNTFATTDSANGYPVM